MKKRIAKKIGRWVYSLGRLHRAKVWEANRIISREWWRSIKNPGRCTKGLRFGKWDPKPSQNPAEPPF